MFCLECHCKAWPLSFLKLAAQVFQCAECLPSGVSLLHMPSKLRVQGFICCFR